MQLTLHTEDGLNLIRSQSDSGIQINEQLYTVSLLLLPDLVEPDWPVTDIDQLTAALAQDLLRHQPDLILLGTGTALRFPSQLTFQQTLLGNGIGCEVMDTAAACRTYNVLASEGRRVLAALIV